MDILMSLHYVRIYRFTINSQVTTVLLAAISQEVPVFFDSWPLANTGSFIPILKNCYLCGGSVGGVVPHRHCASVEAREQLCGVSALLPLWVLGSYSGL